MDDNARAPQGEGRQPADPLSFNSPIGALISALVFLYVGYGLAYEGRSGDALYDGSVAALTWGARGIGIALLAVAGLQLAQLAFASMVDAIVTGLAALLCLGVGLVWLMYSDMQGRVAGHLRYRQRQCDAGGVVAVERGSQRGSAAQAAR